MDTVKGLRKAKTIVQGRDVLMVPRGEVPVLAADPPSSIPALAATITNFLRCGAPAVQLIWDERADPLTEETVFNRARLQEVEGALRFLSQEGEEIELTADINVLERIFIAVFERRTG